MENCFLKLVRSEATTRLQGDMKAFQVLMVVAQRANRNLAKNDAGLSQNEAWISKNSFPNLSEKETRGAKQRLQRGGYASFKGRGLEPSQPYVIQGFGI